MYITDYFKNNELEVIILDNIEYNVYHNQNWSIQLKNIADRKCGIYVFITHNGNKYIGSSEDVRGRIYRHNKKYILEQTNKMIIFLTKDYDSAYDLEQRMIVDIRPELNNRKTYCARPL